ncbi:polymorphic toxin type 25 domain-containing protein, partial [Escherichia coli]|uniref:polymorphic toxin type 25 domain-containing protein n=4 Tax=Enterobacterales TaxID=91347 RepID=UPI001484CFA0
LLFNKEVEKNLAESGFGTGGKYTRAMQAATAAVQGVMGGDLKAALANGAAPFIANEIKKQIPDEETDANLKRTIAHGIANAALALAKGENVAAQAAGAMTGEAIGILAEYIYNKQPGELTEQEKENVSVWATLASGLAGGLAGGDIQSVANAAQAGKTTVENNTFGPNTFFGQMANSVNPDATLAFDLMGKGTAVDEINKAIEYSHQRPSWGVEYKVKPYVKGEAALGIGPGYFYDASVDPSQFAINGGETLAIGGRVSGQVGIQFGPYFPDIGGTERNTSFGVGFGVGNIEISHGKDGVGLSLGAGPSWGWSGISKSIGGESIDINGSSGTEKYKYEFNNSGADK